jgi:type II secretory ATPase GspE/PulE/Tfp pilus assembly ATPase PilB-like protein
LYNLGIEPYLVGATLAGVWPAPGAQALPALQGSLTSPAPEPKAAPAAAISATAGRIGIYELLVPDDAHDRKKSARAPLNELREWPA